MKLNSWKHFLYLYFSHYRWVRRYIGGRWVTRRGLDNWVMWNADDDIGFWKAQIPWPMDSKIWICEEYEWPK